MTHTYWTKPECERMVIGAELQRFWDEMGGIYEEVAFGLKGRLLKGDGFRIMPIYIEDYEAGSCILSRHLQ